MLQPDRDPLKKFHRWWREALADSPLRQKSAICVSTVDADGFPNARFVDLKAVDSEGFKFCSYLDSAKGQEIERHPKVALTLWWDHVGYQVRITGVAQRLPEIEAGAYWNRRSREAQLTTKVCEQSQRLASDRSLQREVSSAREALAGRPIPKPENWGGYAVTPRKIEFLTFREDRLHLREEFTRDGTQWLMRLLQP